MSQNNNEYNQNNNQRKWYDNSWAVGIGSGIIALIIQFVLRNGQAIALVIAYFIGRFRFGSVSPYIGEIIRSFGISTAIPIAITIVILLGAYTITARARRRGRIFLLAAVIFTVIALIAIITVNYFLLLSTLQPGEEVPPLRFPPPVVATPIPSP